MRPVLSEYKLVRQVLLLGATRRNLPWVRATALMIHDHYIMLPGSSMFTVPHWTIHHISGVFWICLNKLLNKFDKLLMFFMLQKSQFILHEIALIDKGNNPQNKLQNNLQKYNRFLHTVPANLCSHSTRIIKGDVAWLNSGNILQSKSATYLKVSLTLTLCQRCFMCFYEIHSKFCDS